MAAKDTDMHIRKHSLIAIAVACIAAGCSFEPKYERPAAPVAAAFPASGVYATQPATSASDTANGRAAADIGWREFFADPRLQRIIEIALANNRDLRVAVLNVDAAPLWPARPVRPTRWMKSVGACGRS